MTHFKPCCCLFVPVLLSTDAQPSFHEAVDRLLEALAPLVQMRPVQQLQRHRPGGAEQDGRHRHMTTGKQQEEGYNHTAYPHGNSRPSQQLHGRGDSHHLSAHLSLQHHKAWHASDAAVHSSSDGETVAQTATAGGTQHTLTSKQLKGANTAQQLYSPHFSHSLAPDKQDSANSKQHHVDRAKSEGSPGMSSSRGRHSLQDCTPQLSSSGHLQTWRGVLSLVLRGKNQNMGRSTDHEGSTAGPSRGLLMSSSGSGQGKGGFFGLGGLSAGNSYRAAGISSSSSSLVSTLSIDDLTEARLPEQPFR